jgi:hypothetical protein
MEIGQNHVFRVPELCARTSRRALSSIRRGREPSKRAERYDNRAKPTEGSATRLKPSNNVADKYDYESCQRGNRLSFSDGMVFA